MKSSVRIALSTLGLALIALVVAPACSNSFSVAPDTGDGGVSCTPNTKECVGPQLARVCPADGASWLPVSCDPTQLCDAGECKANPNVACKPGSGSCAGAGTALRCRANLMGFDAVPCPTGTTCQGAGVCAGACAVGASQCLAIGVLGTCVDGKTFTPVACGAGELCVPQLAGAIPTAACKPAKCTPSTLGCGALCGNPVDLAADQTKFVSTCTATFEGYKWVAAACASTQTCSPTGNACGAVAPNAQAGCASDCTPGQTRCSADLLSTQVCAATGKWGALTTCNSNPSAAALFCMPKRGSPGSAVCGDPVCATGAAGTCDGAGFRACGADGRLAAAAVTCPTGTCVSSGSAIGGVLPGACSANCQAGDERCSQPNANTFQTCAANGTWASPTACPATDSGLGCIDYANDAGRPRKACGGACAPGTVRCATGTNPNDSIQTCNASGQWDAAGACAVGLCAVGVAGAGASCVAQCIPNAPVCMGAAKSGGLTSPYAGTDSYGVCTADGKLPTVPIACAGTTACRKSQNGLAIAVGGVACVTCVGPSVAGGNEAGLVDTRCDTGTSTQSCAADNTFTGGSTACTGALTCSPAQTPFGSCTVDMRRGLVRSASYYATRGKTCQGIKNRGFVKDYGPPIECGPTPDCCATQCNGLLPATPATCK